jgi:hypothetical protein
MAILGWVLIVAGLWGIVSQLGGALVGLVALAGEGRE